MYSHLIKRSVKQGFEIPFHFTVALKGTEENHKMPLTYVLTITKHVA